MSRPFLPLRYDESRPPKERLMGVEGPDGSFIAFPFVELQRLGSRAVLNTAVDGTPLAVLWDSDAETAVVFSRIPVSPVGVASSPVELTIDGDRMVDVSTGDEWSLTGRGLSGHLTGFRLQVYPRAMVAFWFAWNSFHPGSDIWIAP